MPSFGPTLLWERVVALAEGQFGVVSRAQLLDLGCPVWWIGERLRSGLLRPRHQGVYAVGHAALSREGRWLAAALAAGRGAALSHRTAAVIQELPIEETTSVELTTIREVRSQPGLLVHRSRTLFLDDVVGWCGASMTRVERTLIDLTTVCGPEEVEHAADSLPRLDRRRFEAALDRAGPTHPAHTLLVPLLEPDGQRTRSRLERALRRLCRTYDFPRPRTNVRVHGELVDAYWPDHALTVECDSRRWHLDWAARKKDHARDAKLQLHGITPLRLTWTEIVIDPARGAARIRPFMGKRGV